MNYSTPPMPQGTPMPAPSVEMQITRLIERDIKAGRPVTPNRIDTAIDACGGDYTEWARPLYRHLLQKYGIPQQRWDGTLHGPIRNPWEPAPTTGPDISIKRIADGPRGNDTVPGVFAVAISDRYSTRFGLVFPGVDCTVKVRELATRGEYSRLQTRDGERLFPELNQ